MARKTTYQRRTIKKQTRVGSTRLGGVRSLSGSKTLVFTLIFAIIAGIVAWKIFAVSPLQTIEAEQMVLAGNATRQSPPANSDYSVSGGQFVNLTAPASTVSTTFYSTSDISSIGVTVRETNSTCQYYNNLRVTVDGVKLLGGDIIPSTSWKTVTPSPSSPLHGKMSHVLVISRTATSNVSACDLGLLVDKVDLNGSSPTSPSVVIGAAPSTVTDGQSTSLKWNSINTTNSCTASGAWNGSKNQNGAATSDVLAVAHKAYTFNLTCSGPKGVTYSSTTVNVVSNANLLGLPSATTLSRNPATGASAPTGITGNSAVLWGVVSPNSVLGQGATNYYFQYHTCTAKNTAPLFGGSTGGCTINPTGNWSSTPILPLSSGITPIRISYTLTGLAPGTAYLYRIVAVNPAGSATDTGYLASPGTLVTDGTQSFYTSKVSFGNTGGGSTGP